MQDQKLTWISMLYSWMVSHPIPVKIINLSLRVLVPLTERVPIFDVMWYVMQACAALNVTLDEVIEGNVEKLKKRYPGGDFDVHYSENRAIDDR